VSFLNVHWSKKNRYEKQKMSSLSFMPVASSGPSDACFSTVNPHYSSQGTPARMADGRVLTDYRPRCFQYPTAAAAAFGGDEYRTRMIHGADELMAAARELNNRKVTSVSCVDTMVPELYKRVCTWKGCKTIPGNYQGIGTGRIYVPSASGAASDPQALSDMTVPTLPQTFPRAGPRVGSQCALGDPETAWALKDATSIYGSSAKSHPYSAPRA
jgi:hypothetical protein